MKIFVIPTETNQMCNRMFLFGNIIATAIEHKGLVINTAFSEFAHHFVGTHNNAFCRYPIKTTPKFMNTPRFRSYLHHWVEKVAKSAKSGALKNKFKRSLLYLESGWTSTIDDPEGQKALDTLPYKQIIQNRSLVFLDGPLFTNHPGMHTYKTQIKAYFQPVRSIQVKIDAFTKHIHDDVDILVGVHMRLGDYASFSEGRFMFTPKQYSEKMRQVCMLFPGKKVRFLITSNEKQDPTNFLEFDHLLGDGNPIVDLYSLAKCDYIIGPPSTYSSWAAYYGGKYIHHFDSIDQPLQLSDFYLRS